MSTATKLAAPTFRLATLDDYERIAALEASQKMGSMPADDWRHLWLENPLWPQLRSTWPVGWLLEDARGQLVGSMVNIPTRYTFHGRELICANGRGWVVTPEFRGFATQLMAEYFEQSGADLFINTTVGPKATPVVSLLSERIPLGDFQSTLFWITGYRGFARTALQKLYGPAAGLLGDPAALALRLRDALRSKPLPPVPLPVKVEFAESFDARFDAFWNDLVAQNSGTLLGYRDTRSLEWHFAPQKKAGRLWIVTVTRQGRLRAYALFKRQDQADNIRRMHLVDYQTLEPDEDLLPGVLRLALERCARENMFALEQLGRGVPQRASFDRYAPYRYKLESWRCYYKASDPAIHADLSRPEPWAPSTFDGDASFD